MPQPPDLARVVQDVVAGSATLAEVEQALDGGAILNTWISRSASTSRASSGNASRTLLSFTVDSQHTGLVSLLLQQRADTNVSDAKGVTPLHLAAFDGNSEIVHSLLAARARVNAQDRFGQTPLFFAPHRKVCGQLLEALADVNALSGKGQSALHLAAYAGMNDTVFWLAQRMSAETINLPDRGGRTADYLAARKGFGLTTRVLQDHGAQASLRLKKIDGMDPAATATGARDAAPGEDAAGTTARTARTSTPPVGTRPPSREAVPPALFRDGASRVLAAVYERSLQTTVRRREASQEVPAEKRPPKQVLAEKEVPAEKHPPKQVRGFMQMLSEAEDIALSH